MPAKSAPDRARTLGALLRRPYETMSATLYADLARHGFPEVRLAHSAVFRTIEAGGSRISDLAERAGMTKQSMAYLVDSLAASGYVTVAPDATDRRAKRVTLTARGEACAAAALKLSLRHERKLGEKIGQNRMKALRRLLERVYDSLEPEA